MITPDELRTITEEERQKWSEKHSVELEEIEDAMKTTAQEGGEYYEMYLSSEDWKSPNIVNYFKKLGFSIKYKASFAKSEETPNLKISWEKQPLGDLNG